MLYVEFSELVLLFFNEFAQLNVVIFNNFIYCFVFCVQLWYCQARMDDNSYIDNNFADCCDTPNTSQHPVHVKVVLLIYFYSLNNIFAIAQQFDALFCWKCWIFSFIFIAWSFLQIVQEVVELWSWDLACENGAWGKVR